MRTTITLDPDVMDLLRRSMRDNGVSFKQAVNDAVRAGLGGRGRPRRRRFRQRTYELGFRPDIPYVKTLQLADDLEDQELARELTLGK